MKKTASILSTIGFILSFWLLPAYVVLVIVFFMLSRSDSPFGAGNPPLGAVLGVVCIVLAILTLASLILAAIGRAKTMNEPETKTGYKRQLIAGILGLNVLLFLAGLFGLNAKE